MDAKSRQRQRQQRRGLIVSIPILLGIGTLFIINDLAAATWVYAGTITGIGVFLGFRR